MYNHIVMQFKRFLEIMEQTEIRTENPKDRKV